MATWNTDDPALANQISSDIPAIEENFQELHDVVEVITGGTLGTTEPANFVLAGNVGFPATQVPSADANTLDDYEEGYYTATLTCGTSGTITVDTSADQLAYTKIGRMVTVQGTIYPSAISSPVGSLTVNLPVALASLTEEADLLGAHVGYHDISALDAAGTLVVVGVAGSATATIREANTTVLLNDVANHMTASPQTQLRFNFSYIA